MDDLNPYSPPLTPDHSTYGGSADVYHPLKTRAMVASIGIGATCMASFLLDAANLWGADANAEPENLVMQMGILGAVGFLLVAHMFAIVAFSLWLFRAAKNLRGLGKEGMQYTPGWCVGWFFVPIANLFQPFRAVREVYVESTGTVGSVLSLWWATWIIGNILGNAASRINDPIPAGALGLAGSVFTAVAGAACVKLMLEISSSQERMAYSQR